MRRFWPRKLSLDLKLEVPPIRFVDIVLVFGVVAVGGSSSSVLVYSAPLIASTTGVFVVGLCVAAVDVGPDVEALELGGLVTEGKGVGGTLEFLGRRVGVVVMAVI